MSSRKDKGEDELVSEIAKRVTERDRRIAEVLYEHRVLTAQQVCELYFDSIDRAQWRLMQLHQLGVLERVRPYRQSGSNPYHYLLDRGGALLLSSDRGIEISELDWRLAKALRLVSSQQLTHQVQANGIVTRLVRGLRSSPDGRLLEWRGQRRCAQRWGELVRPDSYLRIALDGGSVELWLEHDRSTETHARLQEKLDRYEELALALEQRVTVALTLISDRREQEARRALRPSADVRVLTTTLERHQADPLASNWLAAGEESRIALSEVSRA